MIILYITGFWPVWLLPLKTAQLPTSDDLSATTSCDLFIQKTNYIFKIPRIPTTIQ